MKNYRGNILITDSIESQSIGASFVLYVVIVDNPYFFKKNFGAAGSLKPLVSLDRTFESSLNIFFLLFMLWRTLHFVFIVVLHDKNETSTRLLVTP